MIRLLRRLTALITARRLERELQGEVIAHLELAERDGIAAGLSPEDARRAARRSFGNIESMKELHRDQRSIRWIDTLVRDVRYGLWLLVRDPGFSAVAVGVLAIGIGANAAMFSLVDGILLKPLPYADPDRIVRVLEMPSPASRNGITTLNFLDWKRLSTSFEALSATRGLSAALTGEGEPARLDGMLVSADYFRVFGMNAAIGRTFVAADEAPGAAPVVILSHAIWQERFGSDSGVLNRSIVLDGESHQVVGVLPRGSFDRETSVFWKPLLFAPEQRTRNYHWLGAVGRIRAGLTLEQARAEMRGVSASLSSLQPAFKRDWSVALDPLADQQVNETLRRSITVAFGAVALVLLLAAANIANLMLAKGVSRRREMAVRAAIGAGRGRLIAQVLTESLVLCVIGGVVGIGLAYLMIAAAVPLFGTTIPATASISLDFRVLAFTSAIAIGISLVVGLLPALQISSSSGGGLLTASTRGASSRERGRRLIVAAEVATSLILVCGALLLLKSLHNLQRVDAGVRIENVMTLSADLSLTAYPNSASAAQFIEAVGDRLRTLPGVERAAVSTDVPMLGVRQGDLMSLPGQDGGIGVRFKRVDAEYFATLDIPVIAGRGFTRHDRAGAPRVVVVNESLARRLAERLKLEDEKTVVGHVTRLATPNYENRGQTGNVEDVEIVGVIRNERVTDLVSITPDVVYVSIAQAPRREIKLIVWTRGEPASMVAQIREAVGALDPRLPLGDVRTMEQVKQLTLSGRSEPTWIIGSFAMVAVLLAALGFYGVLSHAVNQRRREIGIRMALGARAPDVLAQVFRNAAAMIVVGLVAGLLGALGLTRLVKSLLFEVSTLDPLIFTAAAGAMLVIGLLAALVPARRATSVDPVTALRVEA
jgi:putative ABC transport system permease protein